MTRRATMEAERPAFWFKDVGSLALGCGGVDVVAGSDQLWHKIGLLVRASEMGAIDLEPLGTRNGRRKRVLAAGGHDLVPRGDEDGGWHCDVRGPVAGRETKEGARCLRERSGIGS